MPDFDGNNGTRKPEPVQMEIKHNGRTLGSFHFNQSLSQRILAGELVRVDFGNYDSEYKNMAYMDAGKFDLDATEPVVKKTKKTTVEETFYAD